MFNKKKKELLKSTTPLSYGRGVSDRRRCKMKIKKEILKIKPNIKFYKRQAMAMIGMPPPTKIHKNKKKYSRQQNKKIIRDALKNLS